MPRDPYRDAIAAAPRSGLKHPPLMVPFAVRGLLRPTSDEGWPATLDMPDGMGCLIVRWGDEGGEAANEAHVHGGLIAQ